MHTTTTHRSIEMIELSLIRIDGGTQTRAELNQDTVDAYAEALTAGAAFPPVTVFFDGKDRWLADGFHRFFAAKKAGKPSILENIIPGTKRDAVLFSLGANGTHGLTRTNADKRNAITTMLQDPEWAKWSNEAIAKQCHVSPHTVADVKKSIYANAEIPVIRIVERNGNTYEQNTANIGKEKAATSPTEKANAEPLPKPVKHAPTVEADPEAPDDYTELDAAHDQILNLQAALVVANIHSSDSEEQNQAAGLIESLRAEIKTLTATVKALTSSRDFYLEENAQMRTQMKMQRREIDKLKTAK